MRRGNPAEIPRILGIPVAKERKNVLTGLVVSIVKTCTRFALATALVAIVLAVGAVFYTARNFEINTDINRLISPSLDWRQRDIAFEKAFDQAAPTVL